LLKNFKGPEMKIKKAVFPVAGLGTRFLPVTKAVPKEMLPIIDRPLIQYAVDEARAAGIEEFIFVTGRGKSAIEDHFDHSYELNDTLKDRAKDVELLNLKTDLLAPGQIYYTRQQEPLGLGHAIWCARHFIKDEPFAILLADDYILSKKPCLKQMIEAHEQTGGNIIAVTEVPHEDTKNYGIVSPGEDNGKLVEVCGLVEKPQPEEAPSNLSVIGRYILTPEVIEHLSRHERGAGNEIQLTDAMAKVIGNKPFHGLRYEGTRFDCGSKAGYLEATVATALQRDDLKENFQKYLNIL
jgi:UTP--glucose-1-phosphate uridylyltransferase